MKVCIGIGAAEPAECNAATGLVPIEGAAHDHYLGDISACQGALAW